MHAGVSFPIDAQMLGGSPTCGRFERGYGDLDLSYVPSGTRATTIYGEMPGLRTIEGVEVPIASLTDIIRSKEAAGRVKDQAQLPALRRTLELVRERERRHQS